MSLEQQFIETIRGDQDPRQAFRLATVDAGHASGRPQLVFDGEGTASTRTYPYLASYTPAAGDRVLVAVVGSGYVVIGKIV